MGFNIVQNIARRIGASDIRGWPAVEQVARAVIALERVIGINPEARIRTATAGQNVVAFSADDGVIT